MPAQNKTNLNSTTDQNSLQSSKKYEASTIPIAQDTAGVDSADARTKDVVSSSSNITGKENFSLMISETLIFFLGGSKVTAI